MKARSSPSFAVLAGLTVVYFVAGKLGLSLAFVNASASAVWPATGIALAALLVFGYRAWPAILLGAFLVNLTNTGNVGTSIAIGVGNVAEALVGAYLVRRFAGGRNAFYRARDIFKFAFFAALVSTMVSASVGVASLFLGGLASRPDLGSIWITWWLGDAAGALVAAPALLLWSTRTRASWNRGRAVEGLLLLTCLVLVAGFVFGGLSPAQTKTYPLEFLCIPLLVWAAFRFSQREAATASVVIAAIAIWGTLNGLGPFTRNSPNEALLLLQAFLAVVTVTTTALAAVVSERRRVQESLSLLEAAVDNAVEGILLLKPDGSKGMPRITFVNAGFTRITGLTAAQLLGETLTVLPVIEDELEPAAALRRALYTGERFHRDGMRARRADGSDCVFELQLTPVPEGAAHPTHWVGILRDVTERVAHLEALERQALYDFLTGLPNRVLLRDRLEQAIRNAGRENAPLALFVMDLDRFKEINDTFGHQFGDLLLKEFGLRLKAVLRTADTVARLGGDEFAVLLPAAGNAAGAALMAEKILASLEKPFLIEGQSLEVSASIGIALCPEDGDDWMTLLRCADVAMYAAKQSSEGYVVYSASADSYGESGFTLMRELHAALDGNQLRLHYLPQVHVQDGRVGSVEALVRWQHPRRGLLLPGQFLPAAERTGAIKAVCEWALETALSDCREWTEAGFPLQVAVNLSGRNLRDPLLVEKITRLLAASKLDASSLKLEISEGSVFADPHGAVAAMTRIRAAGVRLAIDDFGAGESLLAMLKRLPVDEIKLAGALAREMSTDARDAAIVRWAIDLGHSLGRLVVVQDVEDAASWKMLVAYGCDFAQGPHVSGALSREELTRWLEQPTRV
jgi:diguanylate cyclase